MIYADVDVALSKVPVNAAPLTDDTDFKSLETAVAYNAAGMALYWHFFTPNGGYTVTQVTPTTSGTYDWAHQAQGMYTIEIPASGGASINNDTEGCGFFTGFATGVLPWRGPTICFRAAGLNDALIENAYSTTRGLAGTALPAVAAGGAGGLPTDSTGKTSFNDLSQANVRSAVGLASANLDTQLSAIAGYIDTEVAAILAAVDTEVATIVTQTGAAAIRSAVGLTSANLDTQLSAIAALVAASAIRSALGLSSANMDTQLAAIAGYIDTEVAAILAAVDTEVATIVTQTGAAAIRSAVGLNSANLDTQLTALAALMAATSLRSAVGLASANLDSQLGAIAGYIDTEVAAILAAVDTEIADIRTVTEALGATAAARLKRSAETMLPGTVDNSAFSPTTTEFEADDITEATPDHFNGRIVIFTSGDLQYQATDIADYSRVSGRGHFTVTALTEAPANDDTFIIV